jgi:tetratricopeptide (TPR) repeat protein
MKTTILTLVSLLFVTGVFAQQNDKIDNALLLEYYQAQRYQDAVTYLKKAFPEPISDVKVLSRLAYTTQLANNLPEAQSYYQRIFDIDSTNIGALFSIGNINLRRGNSSKAEYYFKKILAKDSTNFSVYTKLASIAADKKDTISAVTYLQKANTLNFFDVDVAVDLSTFYIAQKHFDLALKVLNKASESDPDNIYILISMANLLYKEKKWPETVEACKKLIGLEAADGQIMYKLGVAYYNLKNYACGAETFAGIQMVDQTEYSCYFASLCYKGLKDYNQAIIMMNAAITQSISGNVYTYYGEIADNNEKLVKYKNAIASYQKALLFKDDPEIYYALALLYDNKLKDKATATKYYRLAAGAYAKKVMYTNNPMTYYSLANIYDTQLKDTANAIKFYKKYLDAKPTEKQQSYILYTKSRIDQLQTKN